jgi:hypothetical protein
VTLADKLFANAAFLRPSLLKNILSAKASSFVTAKKRPPLGGQAEAILVRDHQVPGLERHEILNFKPCDGSPANLVVVSRLAFPQGRRIILTEKPRPLSPNRAGFFICP